MIWAHIFPYCSHSIFHRISKIEQAQAQKIKKYTTAWINVIHPRVPVLSLTLSYFAAGEHIFLRRSYCNMFYCCRRNSWKACVFPLSHDEVTKLVTVTCENEVQDVVKEDTVGDSTYSCTSAVSTHTSRCGRAWRVAVARLRFVSAVICYVCESIHL